MSASLQGHLCISMGNTINGCEISMHWWISLHKCGNWLNSIPKKRWTSIFPLASLPSMQSCWEVQKIEVNYILHLAALLICPFIPYWITLGRRIAVNRECNCTSHISLWNSLHSSKSSINLSIPCSYFSYFFSCDVWTICYYELHYTKIQANIINIPLLYFSPPISKTFTWILQVSYSQLSIKSEGKSVIVIISISTLLPF